MTKMLVTRGVHFNLVGKPLTISALTEIVRRLETNGCVTVQGVATSNGTPVTDWLELVLHNLKDRRTDGPKS